MKASLLDVVAWIKKASVQSMVAGGKRCEDKVNGYTAVEGLCERYACGVRVLGISEYNFDPTQ